MKGLEVSSIKPGSILQEVGLADGDIITEANGLALDSPSASAELFREVNDATELSIAVTRADGSTSVIEVPIDD